MLRRACSLVCRVVAWRSLLVLLCISHVAPWGLVGAAVIHPAGGAAQQALAKDNVFNDNNNNNANNFNMNQKISHNANPVIFNNNKNNNNNIQNSNNNDNLWANNNPKPNQPYVAANTNNDNKVKFPPAANPVGNAGLWPAPEKKTWQVKADAQAAPAVQVNKAGGTQPRLVANPPAAPVEKVNLGLGPPPLPAAGAAVPADEITLEKKEHKKWSWSVSTTSPTNGDGVNGFQRAEEDTLAVKKTPQHESDTLFYQKSSDNINQGRTGMQRHDNPIDDKWERETERLVYRPKKHDEGGELEGTKRPVWRPRATPPVPGRYAGEDRGRPSTDGKLFHPTIAYTLFNASYVKNEENNRLVQEQLQAQGLQERPPQWRRRRKIRKPGVTAPPSKPKMDMKQHVSWFEGSRMYAFRASPDTRLLIRHAPIPALGSPWPLPQHYYPEDTVFSLRPEHFQFHAIGETCDVLDFQFDRIRRNTFGDDWEKAAEEAAAAGGGWGGEQEDHKYKEIRYVNVTVLKECPKYPHLNDDESYDLEVKKSGASIIAREVWGAVRAMETFSQLIYQDDEGRYLINRTLINDFPRFPHRGILLDTARHYLNKETVINNLEAMAQNKMNVFHWHITDDQSFPFESKTFPNITKNGAYDSKTHIYTHEVVAEIIEEARLRGIRVIPEFDTPGHTLSWGFGQDYLLTPCYDYSRQPNGLFGPINPILKTTYQFLQKFFREVLAVFKDKYIHLGGDEVPFDCWESNPQIRNFITRNNLSDIRDVLGLYERKLLEIVAQLGKGRDKGSGYIVWQEVVDNGVNVKPDTIVQVWMGDAFDVERMINMGLRVIYSTCWYLDYINYGQDWDKYYRCEQLDQLQDFQLKNSSLLLGGEAALWTEYADDENVISRLWPRASAAAERLWSNKRVRDEVAAASRIEEQRCRMLRRGLKVGVLSGPGHCQVWSHRGRQQQKKEPPIFSWSSHNDEMQFKSNYPQVYVVDMNAMYLVPVLIVICICCLTLITLAQDSKSKIVAILSYPVAGSSKKGVKGLLYVFMAFAFAWCIWTAPIWMNSWETGANKARPVQPSV